MALPNADKLRHILGENQQQDMYHHRFFHVVQSLCVCVCVCVSARACARARVCVCVYISLFNYFYIF